MSWTIHVGVPSRTKASLETEPRTEDVTCPGCLTLNARIILETINSPSEFRLLLGQQEIEAGIMPKWFPKSAEWAAWKAAYSQC